MYHTVKPGDTLYSIARQYNVSTSELLRINSMAATDTLRIGQSLKVATAQTSADPVSLVEYTVQSGDSLYAIAKKFGTTPQDILKSNGLSANSGIYVGQKLNIPSGKKAKETAMQETSAKHVRYYTVQPGDSLYKIAKMFSSTPEELLSINQMAANSSIYIGQRLKVSEEDAETLPETAETAETHYYTVQTGDSLYKIAQQFNSTPQAILDLNGLDKMATIYIGQTLRVPATEPSQPAAAPAPSAASSIRQYHTVKPGEWLAKIAQSYGLSPDDVAKANGIKGNAIYVGQQLIIPQSHTPSVPAHLQQRYNQVKQARSILQLQAHDGRMLFGRGLRGNISHNGYIYPEDLMKVQTRLVELDLLSAAHEELPQRLDSMTGGKIRGKHIPQTLSAIKKLQQRYKLNWWVETPARQQMLDCKDFHFGEVVQGDISHKFLAEFTRFELSFPHPINGQGITARFNNFVRSGYNQFYEGVGYTGLSTADQVPLEVFRSAGLDENLALAMKYVSKHEGNFDAINSYDKAFFSYGFIQFAGGGRGLGPLIARMKVREPQLFKQYFQDLGIDVTYTTRGGDIHKGELHVFDLNCSQGQFEVSGITAEKAIRADHQLYGAFIRAAYHPAFIRCQIDQAVKAYVRPALGIKLNLQTGSLNLQNVPLTDIINSPMGLGFAIDMTVNKWINKTASLFKGGIERVAVRHGLNTYEQLRNIDEQAVIQSIIEHADGDQRIVSRGKSIMHGSLSAVKRPNGGIGLLA